MKRRAILRGLAGVTVATPFLASLGPRLLAQAGDPKRLVIFFTPGGVNVRDFWPTVDRGPLTAASMMGRGVEPLARHTDKLLFVRGLQCGPERYTLQHEMGMASKLTSANLGGGGRHLAQGPSVDYVAAKSVHVDGSDPLILQVGGIVNPSLGGALNYASWKGANEGLAGENQPYNVYRRLMNITPGSEPDMMIARRRQSIADVVQEDLASLRRAPLSREDQQRLDDWLDLVRDTETTMPGGLACSPTAATSIGLEAAVQPFDGLDSNEAGRDGMFKASGEAMMRLAALTLACDQKRVVTIQWAHGGGDGGPTFRWDGMQHNYTHHQISHRNGDDNGPGGTKLSGVEQMVSDIDRWYMTQLASFLDLMDGFTEADGTVLDSSVVAYFNELSDGEYHHLNNLPIILAGSCRGYFKQGEVADCSSGGNYESYSGAPHNRLLTTLLNAVGAKDGSGQPFENFGQFGTPGELGQVKRA